MQVVDQVIQALRTIAQTEVMPRFLRVHSTRKHDGSQLTEADLATQAALARDLPKILPYPVLGEEMTTQEQEALWAQHAKPVCGWSIPSMAPPILCMVSPISRFRWPWYNKAAVY